MNRRASVRRGGICQLTCDAALEDFSRDFMSKIQRALLSVSDKTGLIPLTETLARAGSE